MKYQFNLPTEIIFENGVANKISKFLPSYGISKPLILTDRGVENAGLLQGIYQNLSTKKIKFVKYDDVKPNPKDRDCDLAAKYAKEERVDGIIAVGGGSVIDTAKAVGVLLTHGGSINDWEGESTLRRDIAPLICVSTTAGTGSEVTTTAVITDTKRKIKMGIVDTRIAPKLALLDPELTQSLPPHVTASTGMDALTHAIEAYTSKAATLITDGLALYAIKLIKESLLKAVRNGSNREAREKMLSASLIAGIAFGNSDVGSVHCISEAIGGLYDTPHGVANSIFLPYVFEQNIEANIKKHAEVSYALGADQNLPMSEAAAKGVELLFEMVEKVGIPKLSCFPNVNPNDFPYLAKIAKETPMDVDNARDMSEEDYLRIIRSAYSDS